MNEDCGFSLPESFKIGFVSGIFDAISHDIPELIQENNLPTTNGAGQFRYNYINKNLKTNLQDHFQITVQKRGPWKFPIFFDINTGLTFSVTSENNLHRLRKNKHGKMHYLEALSCHNPERKEIEGQVCMEEIKTKKNYSELEKLREVLLIDFAGNIKDHVLILFDYNGFIVTSVRAVVLNPDLGVIYSENWSSYLGSSFEVNTLLLNYTDSFEEEVTLVKVKNNDDSLVDLSSKRKKNTSN